MKYLCHFPSTSGHHVVLYSSLNFVRLHSRESGKKTVLTQEKGSPALRYFNTAENETVYVQVMKIK